MSRAVQESSESPEFTIVQEIQNPPKTAMRDDWKKIQGERQNRCEGRLEENSMESGKTAVKDDRKEIQGERHRWLDPKHEKPYAVKKVLCYKNIKYSFKRERGEKKFLRSQLRSNMQMGSGASYKKHEAQEEQLGKSKKKQKRRGKLSSDRLKNS